ncbi:MAG: hypothetical protein H0T51_07305 [Pirellulales bacterium]|nr:hypothetical protein [Pirellulales bacterium]
MDCADAIDYQPMSAEQVFHQFQAWHRQAVDAGEGDPSIELTMDSTITDWLDAHLDDTWDWRSIARGMNDYWRIDVPLAVWRDAIKPFRKRTLRNVCNLIAEYALNPVIRPVVVFGTPCLPAGAFFAVKQLLHEDGANVAEVTPSCSLSTYTRIYAKTFFGPISQLNPGALPPASIYHPFMSISNYFSGAGVVLIGSSLFVASPWLTIWGVVLAFLGMVGGMVISTFLLPASVTFRDVNTFRDLSLVLSRPATIGAASTADASNTPAS